MDEKRELTRISKNNGQLVGKKPKTAKEVVDFLEHEAMYRSFAYLVSELYEGEDVEKRLRQGLCEITGEADEKVRKNVQNWMKGKSLPQKREVLFQICFILGLDEEKSNRLLGSFSENRIHYRNPAELAYAFALRTGRSYQKAVLLRDETLRIYEAEKALHRDEIREIENIRLSNASEKRETARTEDEKRQKREKREQEEILYTDRSRELFETINTEEDYMNFIHQNSIYFGMRHESAYAKFMELLNLLQDQDEEQYSMRKIVEDYFRMNVPQTAHLSNMTALQKLVKKCWPSETTLSRMKNRDIDVNRKTLILLYLLTGEFDVQVVNEEEFFFCDEEYTPEELFQTRCEQMDFFLKKYGMNTLDYGNPFDLIVIYALHPGFSGEEEFASDRIDKVLELLYEGIYTEEG